MFASCPVCQDEGLVQLDFYRPDLWGVCECEAGKEMRDLLTLEVTHKEIKDANRRKKRKSKQDSQSAR